MAFNRHLSSSGKFLAPIFALFANDEIDFEDRVGVDDVKHAFSVDCGLHRVTVNIEIGLKEWKVCGFQSV